MTRQLYNYLYPAYNSKDKWQSNTILTLDAEVEINFWESNIVRLNGFFIKPVLPTITVCEIVAGDASEKGHYAAKFSDKN